MCYSEGLAICQGSRIWPKCDITRRQRPMRALVTFTLQRNLHTNMCRTHLLGYSQQPACSDDWLVSYPLVFTHLSLDDQTQVDSKPAGQPEQASLNQCQLIVQNWCSEHPQLTMEIRYFCYVIDTRALIGPCSHVALRWCQIWYFWHESNSSL